MEQITYPMRINRYLALKGYCSRREADNLIVRGIVRINGRSAKLGDKIIETDQIEIIKKEKLKEKIYFAYYKPRGIVTHSPQKGEKEIKDKTKFNADIFPLGRLDKESHGLIILTNDGRITDKLLNPEYEHEKEYVVKVDKKITNFLMRHMAEGVELEDCLTKPAVTEKIDAETFRIILVEGKRHQIRRMCAALGYVVRDLKRVRIMNIRLGDMKSGQKRQLAGAELKNFLTKLGL